MAPSGDSIYPPPIVVQLAEASKSQLQHSIGAIRPSLDVDPLLVLDDAYRVWVLHINIQQQLDSIRQRKEDWDGYGSRGPNTLSLAYAKHLLDELLISVIAAPRQWIAPFITSDEDGHITAEWYSGERELHIIVREHKAVYIKVWGTNIENEMHVDVLGTEDYLDVWDWLRDGQ